METRVIHYMLNPVEAVADTRFCSGVDCSKFSKESYRRYNSLLKCWHRDQVLRVLQVRHTNHWNSASHHLVYNLKKPISQSSEEQSKALVNENQRCKSVKVSATFDLQICFQFSLRLATDEELAPTYVQI